MGKGALDPEAQNLCGNQHGKFGVACREALSLIPGGPTDCHRGYGRCEVLGWEVGSQPRA